MRTDPVTRLAELLHARPAGDGWTARCPGHDDRRASLSLNRGDDGRALLHCHAGCAVDAILAALGLRPGELFPTEGTSPAARIVTTYDYTDATGTLLYQVVRYAPKAFRQRRPDPAKPGAFVWNLNGQGRVLYRLPELSHQPAVILVEGEKDADRLWMEKFPATCNSGGAGKWRDEYPAQLKAAGVERVAIIPDNDGPGREHAAMVAQSCHAADVQVRIVELPDVPVHGDVSDWLAAGHTRDELIALVKAAPAFTPAPAAAPEPAEPPRATPVYGITSAPVEEAGDLGGLLTDVQNFIRRYVVLTDDQVVAVAFWTVHTRAIAAADCTPYLQITSATKRAGKTRLLEVLESIVCRPWLTGRTSAAALTRKIDGEQPTLLLDESDAAFKGEKEYAEALRGILNSGY